MMKPVLPLALALTLAGCATRTPYERPPAPLPGAFEHAPLAAPASQRPEAWWRAFGDPALEALVDLAIARNPDLAASAVRVRRSALEARLAGNALLPIPNGSLSTGVSRGMSGSNQSTTESASGSLGVSWEIDLFGRIGAQRDAARFEALATREDRDGILLSLVGTTASLYWQIAFANERISLGEQSLAYARRTQALVEMQYRAGAVSALERREIEQSVTAQISALADLRQARVQAREALTVLLDGMQPPEADRRAIVIAPLPPIAQGLPVDLLGRRPDLRAAELRLRGTLASADATRASFYPALTLTGALGTSSTSLLNVLTNPVGTLGAGLTLPFLNVRAMRFETAIARARYEEAVILFRKTLYAALADVETALSAREQLAAQGEALQLARAAAVDAERLYEIRYRAGAVPLRNWLDAQERRRAADLAFSANRLTRLQNQVTLHQVLGGGFAR